MTDKERLLDILSKPIFPHELVDPLEAVADYLLDNGVTFAKDMDAPSKWISVEDKLPTKEDADKVGHVMAIIKGDDFAQIFSWNTVAINPRGFTHWMPLPKTPKED